MRSWIGGNRKVLFQQTKLDAFMTPEDLLARIKKLVGGNLKPGTVIYSGTVSALIDGYPFADHFECELLNPITHDALVCKYGIHMIQRFD